MATWLLALIGLSVFRMTVEQNGVEYDIGSVYRLLLFVICCIYG